MVIYLKPGGRNRAQVIYNGAHRCLGLQAAQHCSIRVISGAEVNGVPLTKCKDGTDTAKHQGSDVIGEPRGNKNSSYNGEGFHQPSE